MWPLLLRKAADQGVDRAQYNLGVMYDNGTGVPLDDAEATKWYRKSAEQGYAPAQSNLGAMYDRGEGVPRDLAEACAWFCLAADSDETARKNRDLLLRRLSLQERTLAERREKQLRHEIVGRMTEAGEKAEGK